MVKELHERDDKEKLWNNENREPVGKENGGWTGDIKTAIKEISLASITSCERHKRTYRIQGKANKSKR